MNKRGGNASLMEFYRLSSPPPPQFSATFFFLKKKNCIFGYQFLVFKNIADSYFQGNKNINLDTSINNNIALFIGGRVQWNMINNTSFIII